MKKTSLLVVSTMLMFLGFQSVSCGGTQEEEVKPEKLNQVTNLLVKRTENKWEVTFDEVENATGYLLKVTLEDNALLESTAITSGYQLDVLEGEGNFVFSVIATSTDSKFENSDATSFDYKVELYNEKETDGIKLTGRVEQGLPIGDFKVVYSDGAIYEGTLTDNFLRNEGTLTYANKMYYSGTFVDDKFEGQGVFSWSTTGNYKEGNTYTGEFKAGGFDGCVGTFTTPANFTRAITDNGILNYTGEMSSTFGQIGKVGTSGTGEFQFANNSIYKGDLFVRGVNDFVRKGFGLNTWIVNENSSWINGAPADTLIYGFEGNFDGIDHAWIYGDGIWYFNDLEGNPKAYIKGNWDGGIRLGDATTELTVLDSFKNATEIKL